jgi:sec-independent protein translocase protein TatA
LCSPEAALPSALGRTPLEELMPGKLGLPEILLILAVALLIFGPSKLADLGKGLGEGIKNFKSAVKDGEQDSEKKS